MAVSLILVLFSLLAVYSNVALKSHVNTSVLAQDFSQWPKPGWSLYDGHTYYVTSSYTDFVAAFPSTTENISLPLRAANVGATQWASSLNVIIRGGPIVLDGNRLKCSDACQIGFSTTGTWTGELKTVGVVGNFLASDGMIEIEGDPEKKTFWATHDNPVAYDTERFYGLSNPNDDLTYLTLRKFVFDPVLVFARADRTEPLTASPTPAPTTVATASGDPHLRSVFGATFDIYKEGAYELFNMSRLSNASSKLSIQIEVESVGCISYIRQVTIFDAWTEGIRTIKLTADNRNGQKSRLFTVGPLEVWIQMRMDPTPRTSHSRKLHFNVKVTRIPHTGVQVGGLLGLRAAPGWQPQCKLNLDTTNDRPKSAASAALERPVDDEEPVALQNGRFAEGFFDSP